MKELSIEEKAKAYDIALNKIKMLLGTGSSCSREELEYVFPELKESEDEKIRKELIDYFKENNAALAFNGISNERVIAWLEKQGEQKHQYKSRPRYVGETELLGQQKPAEWSNEDEDNLNSAIYYIRREPYRECDVEPVVDWLRNKLKSLRPQSQWKPSEGQMELIKDIVFKDRQKITRKELAIFHSIYNDLKKLREE